MSTTRRSFLITSLTALAAAPLLAKAALSPKPTEVSDFVDSPAPGQWGVLVRGVAIKVPSNRYHHDYATYDEDPIGHYYHGSWDGTYKIEEGCTNPAWILADLYERTNTEPDWAVAAQPSFSPFGRLGVEQLLRPQLNWQMLYDWGVWCDEVVAYGIDPIPHSCGPCRLQPHRTWSIEEPIGPRLSFCTVCDTRDEMVRARETIRKHCLNWQSIDPRYRTSWRGENGERWEGVT